MTGVKIFFEQNHNREELLLTEDTFVMYNLPCKFTFVTFDTIVLQLHVRVKRERSHS